MITINLDKAKGIAHEARRQARSEEFKPYDDVIAKQIPGLDTQAAENARQAVREKYAAMQAQIDAAQTPDEIKSALGLDAAQ